MKIIEIIEQDKKLLTDIRMLLTKSGFDTDIGDKENELFFDLQPRLHGKLRVKNGKIEEVVIQGENNDIYIGEMDLKTLVKDLKVMNTKKWFKEWDPAMKDWQ